MKGLRSMLIKERDRAAQYLQVTSKRLKNAPEGHLRVSRTGKYTQFYHCDDENKYGTYISKGKDGFIQKLAQKHYDQKVEKLAQKRVTLLERLLKEYKDDEFEQIYLNEHPERQKFIHPVEPTWKQLLDVWKNTPYIKPEISDDIPVIMTERGERVRSKSEKIIADYFYHNGIEYKYECPLRLNNGKVIYPDFTLLSSQTRQEVYLEHLGMMDDPQYARRNVRKIDLYEKSGLFIGERLLLTFETSDMILSTKKLEELVKRYL